MNKVRYISIALAIGLLTFVAPTLLVTVTADPPDPTPQPVEEWSPGDPLILIESLAYPPDPTSDTSWPYSSESSVADIQSRFNTARTNENNQLGTLIPMLTMPSQAEWDSKSDGEKALWLINREREDRGIHPLHGLEANVTSVAQWYAEYLMQHDEFGHEADGRTSWERLNDNAAIGACHDFLSVAENLGVYWGGWTLPIERAVHDWMYDDSGSFWEHRHAVLWYPYNDNSGPTGKEGFLGIGRATGTHQGWPNSDVIVMNVFDPCSTWVYPSTSSISLNYQTGKPGSFFKVTGQNFPANTTVTISVNGQQVGTINTDGSGGFVFSLQTSASAQEGVYTVSVNGAAAIYWLDQNETLWTKDPDGGETVQVPDSIAPYSNFVHLPLILRSY